MRNPNPLCCGQCGIEIREGGIYYASLGDVLCRECAEEFMKDEIETRFDELFDELAYILGVTECVNYDPF